MSYVLEHNKGEGYYKAHLGGSTIALTGALWDAPKFKTIDSARLALLESGGRRWFKVARVVGDNTIVVCRENIMKW